MGKICQPNTEAIWLNFQCFGKGQIKIWEYKAAKFEKPFQDAMRKLGITSAEFDEVTYQHFPVDRNKTLEELELPNGGIIIIKTKATF